MPGTQSRPGGRSSRVRSSVLESTIALLAASGWSSLSVDAVAAASGVHRTTIYRRWGDVQGLVAAAIAEHSETTIPIPDSGSLADDLRELARSIAAEVQTPLGRALLRIALSATDDQPELTQIRRQFFLDRYRLVAPVVARAIERGEAPSGTDPIGVARTLSAPLLMRFVTTGDQLDEAAADQAAAVAVTAAREGIFVSPVGHPSTDRR